VTSFDIWTTPQRTRYFLVAVDAIPEPGTLVVTTLDGKKGTSVSAEWLAPFEISEEQARRVAKDQLGDALSEIRGAIDEKLSGLRRQLDAFNRSPVGDSTPVTPNAVSALFELITELPRAIGQSLSGVDERVKAARESMAGVQQRLKDAGIDVEDHLAKFPDRLAELRNDASKDRDRDRDPGSQ
jgi:hypothetical protein